MTTNNNVLQPFKTATDKYDSIIFETIKIEHYMPALKEAIRVAHENYKQIRENKNAPTFENTILALESAADDIGDVAGVYYTLLSADASAEHQALAEELSPLLAEFDNDITLDPKIFARVKTIYDSLGSIDLDAEQTRLVERTYLGFSRNGALLNDTDKDRLREIDKQTSVLSPQFQQNLLKATNAFTIHITSKDDLTGLPESAMDAAAHEAKNRQLDGWVFSLQVPSMMALMTYSDKRELRKEMSIAFSSRSYRDEFDNQDILKKIVKLRHERARLLGYEAHSNYVLEQRMAETSDTVMEFLDRICEVSQTAAKADLAELLELAKELDGIEELKPWDIAYYSEKLKVRKHKLDEEEIRQYFRIDNVIQGAFDVIGKLYHVDFKEIDTVSRYHEDVKTFEVSNNGVYKGLLYIDLYPRDTKQGGAWQSTLRDQGTWRGKTMRPHAMVVCNFTPSTPDRPSLLKLDEVRTLFHELGHAMHNLLSECTYNSLSGSSVFWDFVELPSQIMENWMAEKEGLDIFAQHYKTNEKMPVELIERIKAAQNFQAGYTSMRQVHFGYLDMMWHLTDPGEVGDVGDFEAEQLKRTQILPRIEGTSSSTAFGHIFAGGYSSGYYSYKWAEVLEADAFELFLENGIFDQATADSFRINVMSKGNSAPPMDLFVAFRGRKPDPNALLRRSGLLT
jgi:peptidyl-dipeptidase Dcp